MPSPKMLVSAVFGTTALLLITSHQTGPAVHLAEAADLSGGTSAAPNVLLIVADDLGVDKVGVYAHDADPDYIADTDYMPVTAILDNLAHSGVRFTDAWANPTCSPTRATLLTGTHAFRHEVGSPIGYPNTTPELDPDTTVSLADTLSDAGYATALIGKWHLGEGETPPTWNPGDEWHDHLEEVTSVMSAPVSHGFDLFNGSLWGNLAVSGWGGYTDYLNLIGTADDGGTTEAFAESEYATAAKVGDALDWIAAQSDPWFLVLSLNAPHTPLASPPGSCGYRGPLKYQSDTGESAEIEIEVYQQMVECLDEQLERLFDNIRDLDDTLILFMGDNGTEPEVAEGVYDDGRGKGTLYENGIRVPLIITDGRTLATTLEGFTANGDWLDSPVWVENPGREIETPVHVVDLFATLAEITGAAADDAVDSTSLVSLLQDTSGDAPDDVYTELFEPEGEGTAAYRKDQYKLIVTVERRGPRYCRSSYELYDLDSDRFEQTDLSTTETSTLSDMVSAMEDLIGTADGSIWLDAEDCSGA